MRLMQPKARISVRKFTPAIPDWVVAEGAVRAMTWGFPLVLKGKQGQPLKPKPVNNARQDKLGTFFWSHSFEERRCLIPLTAWAEAEGGKGRMTRTWMNLPDAPLFAAAGVWWQSEEWGACYSMVMIDSAGSAAADVHSRMPVLLASEDHARWLTAPADEALTLCQPWPGALSIDRTDQSWVKGAASQPGLL
jgi:putative SOS response-associated peptidase YedK